MKLVLLHARAATLELLTVVDLDEMIAHRKPELLAEDGGTAELKGVPGEWRLYSVVEAGVATPVT